MSCEYLLMDRFVCELSEEERKFIQSVDTWTLKQLKEYFLHQQVNIEDHTNRENILMNNALDSVHSSRADPAIDIGLENAATATVKSEPDSHTANEMPIDGMENENVSKWNSFIYF